MVLTVTGTCPVNACTANAPANVDTAINHLIDATYATGADVTGSSLTFSVTLGITGFTAALTITPNGQELAITTAAVACVAELLTFGHVATFQTA